VAVLVEVVLEDVTKSFADVIAVDDISLKVDEGELFFLLGPSGCGKTTTLRLIAGFYKPEGGRILFDDRVMNNVPPNKRNVGMVFQNYALWPHMTVYENVTYGLKVRGVPANLRVKKAREVLRIVKMEKYAGRYPNQLSGGQQQRIALARALVIEPDVLLLDEPLSNLDAKLRLETREEIKRIQRDLGITTVYVTHDQNEALSMADRIAVMNEGRIEQIGTPREIYNDPANKFVAGFIGETNFIEGRIEDVIEEKELVLIKTPTDEKIHARITGRNLTRGENVCCSVRPERIRVLREKVWGASLNLFPARIQRLSYYGFAEHFVLEAMGMEVKVTHFAPESTDLREGDDVYFTFSPEDVNVFRID
jgi:iron(III) transport system ATP-binding protein